MLKFFTKLIVKNARGAVFLSSLLLLAACSGSADDRAQSYYERGMKLLAQQDYVKAGIEFRNALQLKQNLVVAWRGLAQIEERSSQNPKNLIAIQRTIVELDPNDFDAKLKLARLMFFANSLDDALNMVNAAGELNKQNAGVYGLKAMILAKLGDGSGALREAKAALDLDPANNEATAVLAAERFSRGDAKGALALVESDLAGSMANDIGVQLFKLRIFEQMGDTQRVEVVLRKLIELYPQQPAFRRALVQHYLNQQHPEEAEKELYSLAAANPSDVETALDLIQFLRATKGSSVARQELMNRIKAGQEVFRFRMALADFDLVDGKVDDSIKLLEDMVATAHSSERALEAQAKLAGIFFGRKNFDAAEKLVSEILRKDSRNVDGLKLRAALRMENGQLDAAIADARQALNEHPRSAELSLLLAAAYERSGSIELAEKQYAEASKLSSTDTGPGLQYVTFLRRRGSPERAEDVLNSMVTRWPNNSTLLLALADAKMARQDWVGAQEVASAIKRLSGNTGVADQISGLALGGQQKYDQSIAALQKAYTASPNARPMGPLISALIRGGKLNEAEDFLTTVLKSNPENAEALVLLGSIQGMKNAPEQAIKSYRTAIEKQPKNTAGYEALSGLQIRQNDINSAMATIRAGLQQRPDDFGFGWPSHPLSSLRANTKAQLQNMKRC